MAREASILSVWYQRPELGLINGDEYENRTRDLSVTSSYFTTKLIHHILLVKLRGVEPRLPP